MFVFINAKQFFKLRNKNIKVPVKAVILMFVLKIRNNYIIRHQSDICQFTWPENSWRHIKGSDPAALCCRELEHRQWRRAFLDD